MTRLPRPGRYAGIWGDILNEFLMREHNADGTLKIRNESMLASAVTGPNSATTDTIARFSGASGKIVQGSNVAVNDDGAMTMPANQPLTLSAYTPTGKISQLITMKMTTPYDRPWIVWLDENSRMRASSGYHSLDYASSTDHSRYEIKTSASPSNPNPLLMLTRFAIGTDKDQAEVIFNFVKDIEINRGTYAQNVGWGVKHRLPYQGSTLTFGSWLSKLDEFDNTIVEFEAQAAAPDKTANIRFFRNTETTAGAFFRIHKADGTATDAFLVNASTGEVTTAGKLTFAPEGIERFSIWPKSDISGDTLVDIDTPAATVGGDVAVRLFRNTSTSGNRTFSILKGDNTNTETFAVDAASGNVTVTGNLTVNGTISSATSNESFDDLELRRSSQLSTMSRLLMSTNLNLTSGTVFSAAAYSRTAGTFTKIRFATGSTAPVGLTEVRLGVWNAAGVLLASTANISATVTAASQCYIDIALSAPVTTTANQQLYLGIVFIGTSLQVRGTGVIASAAALPPQMSRVGTYAGGGVLPTLGSSASGNLAWIELSS